MSKICANRCAGTDVTPACSAGTTHFRWGRRGPSAARAASPRCGALRSPPPSRPGRRWGRPLFLSSSQRRAGPGAGPRQRLKQKPNTRTAPGTRGPEPLPRRFERMGSVAPRSQDGRPALRLRAGRQGAPAGLSTCRRAGASGGAAPVSEGVRAVRCPPTATWRPAEALAPQRRPLASWQSEVSQLWFCRPGWGRVHHLGALIPHPTTGWTPGVFWQMEEA